MKYLIIGASSGLGKELAKKFAEENNDLVIVSRDERDLNAIKSDLEIKHKIKIDVLPLNFSSINEIEDKLLSNNNLISNLTGALFPIGMMFNSDNLNLSVENISKLTNANFISIAYTIQKIKKILIQVSGFLGRDINVTYAGAKRGLESYFESMAFDEEFEKINIQFYTLGYLATNLSFGKDLKLPKGSVKKLSNIVFNNRMAKFKKTYYPAYWMIIHLILKIIPFSILRILKIK